MKIIFFGSSSFAVPTLKKLVEAGFDIDCVITQPDRLKGRGLHLAGTDVKSAAEGFGLKLYQPKDANSAEAIRFIRTLEADLFIVVSYGQILSEELLRLPKVFSINAHASILPKYRGAAPINWAIINGETVTGVSIIKLTPKMDAGPLMFQGDLPIADSDTAFRLEERLSVLAANLVIEALAAIINKRFTLIEQDESKVTFAPKLKKKDGLIPWQEEAKKISDRVRGLNKWPGAYTYYKDKMLKILEVKIKPGVLKQGPMPGEIVAADKEGIAVAAKDGIVEIKGLQPEGKRIMSAPEFISGHKICVGERLGAKNK